MRHVSQSVSVTASGRRASFSLLLSHVLRRVPLIQPTQQTMYTSTLLVDVLLVICLCQWCVCAPYRDALAAEQHEMGKFSNRETKKDIFISRGWGAGGMPFSVLYMNPTFSASKAPATAEANFRPQHAAAPAKSQRKSLPQVRNSMRQKGRSRTPHSVIPQLFVSYGWGPLGKK